ARNTLAGSTETAARIETIAARQHIARVGTIIPNESHQGVKSHGITSRAASTAGIVAAMPATLPIRPQISAWVSTSLIMNQGDAPNAFKVANSSIFSMVVA